MDDKFRSSFIPKAPLVGREDVKSRRSSAASAGPLLPVSFVVLLLAGLSVGGMYFYKNLVNNEIQAMEAELETARQEFEPADIARYKRLDDRLRVADDILTNHRVSFAVFDLLSDITMSSVQFTSFSFQAETSTPVRDESTTTFDEETGEPILAPLPAPVTCLLYTSDAADDLLCVDLGGRR